MLYQQVVPLLASETDTLVSVAGLATVRHHTIVATGEVQVDFYVNGHTSPVLTVTAVTGTPLNVELLGASHIKVSEVAGVPAAATVTISG